MAIYKEHEPNHAKYWRLVAAELQTWHGNALWNRVRGSGDKLGVPYRDILCDVCDEMEVNYNKKSEIELIEKYLCEKVLSDSIGKMKPEDLRDIVEGLNLQVASFTPQAIVTALQLLTRSSGFLPYKWVVILANSTYNSVFRRFTRSGLSLAANAALPRSLARLVGPVGLTLTALWTAYDLAGPAYRVTRPAVILIACLRAGWRPGQSDGQIESPNALTE